MLDEESGPRLLAAHQVKGIDRTDEVQLIATTDGHFSLVVNCYKDQEGKLVQDYDESWCYTTQGLRGLERTVAALGCQLGVTLFS